MQIRDWVLFASGQLREAGWADDARLEAELLIAHQLDKSRSYLFAYPEATLDGNQLVLLNGLLQRRLAGEPVAYITGRREFWSLSFNVDASVLIPRPETESLVEQILSLDLPDHTVLFDLGTGSGAIAVALASERSQWFCVGVDSSAAALQVASANVLQLLGAESNCALLQSDWLSAIRPGCADIIVSNPPYIAIDDSHLVQGDVRFEPDYALVSANAGLADIEKIAATASVVLKPGGWLVVEHGWRQQDAVVSVFEKCGYSDIRRGRDLSEQPRYVSGRRPPDD